MQGNILGQTGGSAVQSFFTIYQQILEPSKKEGIWIKSDEKIKDVYYQTDMAWEPTELATLPYGYSNEPLGVVADNEIYLFGLEDNASIKYNITTNNYVELQDLPDTPLQSQTAVVSNEIYMFSFRSTGRIGYKYNIDTDTYTKLSNFPIDNDVRAPAINVSNDMYFFGVRGEYTYKYNMTENTYTNLGATVAEMSINCTANSINNDIYIFGVYDSYNSDATYKYNIIENEYTKQNIYPHNEEYKSSLKINEIIYLLQTITNKDLYKISKYYQKNNSYYRGEDIELQFILNTNKHIYSFKYISANSTKIYLLKNKLDNHNDGLHIVLSDCNMHNDMDTESVLDVFKVKNGEEQSTEVYLGDGNEWKLLI